MSLDQGRAQSLGSGVDDLRTTLVLTRSDLDGLVTMAEVIEAVEAAHADTSRGTAVQPTPTAMALASSTGAFLVMPSLADRQGLAAVKLLADLPGNAAHGLPVQRSVVILVSQATGACQAIFHGQIPTRIRTAAASAVATRHLSRADSRILGLVGAGDLAIEHVSAIAHVRPISTVRVWSRNPATVARFVEQVSLRHPEFVLETAHSARDVVEGSDIVCTVTPSREPLVEGAWFQPGLHLNAVGAPPRPDHREIDSAGMARGRLFVDSIGTALHESGEILLAIADGTITRDQVSSELGQVITGHVPGRLTSQDITVYNSVGLGIQDLAIGGLLLERARSRNVGMKINLGA